MKSKTATAQYRHLLYNDPDRICLGIRLYKQYGQRADGAELISQRLYDRELWEMLKDKEILHKTYYDISQALKSIDFDSVAKEIIETLSHDKEEETA